jgi:hypothetical protein
MHKAFFQHVYRPTYLVKQAANTLKSLYRINVFMNNLSRIGEIRDAANSVA